MDEPVTNPQSAKEHVTRADQLYAQRDDLVRVRQGMHLHLAEAYLKVGRRADARKHLDSIISMKSDQNYLPEYKEAVSEARKLLEKPDDQTD